MYFPGGLSQVFYALRDAVFAAASKRHAAAHPPVVRAPAGIRLSQATTRREFELPADTPALRCHDISVRFGGVAAVDTVSISVASNEIVGLIGANGAGKTTLMNAIGGYVPSSGGVELLGREVSGRSPAARARLGLGRAFQNALLFSDLTVKETVMLAFEAHEQTHLVSSTLGLPRARRAERRKDTRATELIDLVGLERYQDLFVSDLSTGTRRICELACLLALDARVLCLDEPTAGIAQRETEAFGPLLRDIQAAFGCSMLVIEHDMPMVMSLSDRVYCLDAGSVIAEGSPDAVRNDPLVIAAYLGTDERTINRSDTGRAAETIAGV